MMHEPNTMFESSTISIFNIYDEIFSLTIVFRKDILFNGVDFSFISRVKTFLLHECSFSFTSCGSKNIYWYKAARACFRIVIVISQC